MLSFSRGPVARSVHHVVHALATVLCPSSCKCAVGTVSLTCSRVLMLGGSHGQVYRGVRDDKYLVGKRLMNVDAIEQPTATDETGDPVHA
eukprot:m.934627 g.934627  ORF g.934627 m.934627 type:complete len:90 (-) comp23799_c0_seq10:168-437(-)